ncbi:hypothetical protein TNCV_2607251 [Trichonephila clavipes]|uniref:Uncharacterized protein n=1 Tax=Trichonephila clavipes TaxID=2585209 RepID=A0A8X6RVS4_TRICX|nr:hypothetical protein TNCV_2607251 [Trichonephila clavipes]
MHHGEKKGAIASRRLDFYLLVRGRNYALRLVELSRWWGMVVWRMGASLDVTCSRLRVTRSMAKSLFVAFGSAVAQWSRYRIMAGMSLVRTQYH